MSPGTLGRNPHVLHAEHNVDSYFFLRDLGYLSSDAKYADAANLVKKSLLENHWNAAEGRFNQGVSDQGPDTADALDIGSWGGIFLLAVGDQAKAASSAEYIKKFRVNGATIAKSTDPETYNQTYESAGPIDGYKPYLTSNAYPDAPEVVWAEGTWGAILFRKRLGEDVSSDLASMERMQAADPKGGFVQVTRGRKSLPYEFHVWPAVGGTGWAALVLGNPGLLWKQDRWIDNYTPPTPPEPDPAQSEHFGPALGDNPSGVGDPVNATTGNVYDFGEDLNLPGRGLPLQFARFYNSQDTIRKPLGHGWTHSFNARLKENPDGSVTELAPQGQRLTFAKNADGSYAAPKSNHDVLTKASDGSFKLAKKNGVEWLFGPQGKLQKITDPNGDVLDLRYTNDRLTSIVDATGRETRLSYNGSGRLTSLTDQAGREVRYGYSLDSDLTSVTDPAGNVTRYAYDANHNLTKTTKPDGGTVSFAYDGQDRATSSEADGGAQRVSLAYDPANKQTTVTDSKGNPSVFNYDAQGKVTKIVDPYLKEILYAWDADGNLASRTDGLGNTTTFEYDGRGNPTKVTLPKLASQTTPYSTSLTYEPGSDRPASVTDPKGGTTSFSYDGQGNLTSVTDAEGGKTTFEYDAQGQLVKTVDPKGNATSADPADGTTTYSYDAQGNLAEITDAAANASAATPKKTTRLAYGADANSLESVLGLPSSVTDPLGRTTDLGYGRLGRLTQITYPLTPPDTARASASMTYDAAGNPTSFTDEKGNKTSYSYDGLGHLTKVVDPRLKETVYAYGTEGNLASKTDPMGQKTTYEYDKMRRLTKVVRPDGTTAADGSAGVVSTSYGYDAAGRQTSVTDPKGRVTQLAYDELSRLVKTTEPVATGTVSGSATYEYDALGQITKVTNPNGHATSYAYDKLGRLLKETDPLGNATSYAYDPNGNVKSRTDANAKLTNYAYDPLNRLLTTSYPDGTKVDNRWDEASNLLSTADKTGTTSYGYDERNRLVSETFPGSRVLRHEYDPAGNRTALVDPEGKRTLFAYDAADRMASVTDRGGHKTAYTYDDADRPTKVLYASGANDVYTYDPLGRVKEADNNGGGTNGVLAKQTYAYDKSSNPTSVTYKDGKQSAFAYDALDRLTKETHPDQTLSYAYDAAGNRKSLTRSTPTTAATTTSYTYDAAERMTAAGATTFAYDKNGNQTSRTSGTTTTAYAYDFEDGLVKAGTETYARDALGRVASSTIGTTKTDYVYDGPEVLEEKVGTAAATHYTRGLGDTLISRRAGTNAPNYYHYDAVGSVTALSGGGALTDSYLYTAFGNSRGKTGTTAQPYQYLGNAFDSNSGFYDFHARAYNANVGRFTSKDPVKGFASMPQTLTPYAYGLNNPLAYPDPYGMLPPEVERQIANNQTVYNPENYGSGGYYLNQDAAKASPSAGGVSPGLLAVAVPIAIAEPTPIGELILLGTLATGAVTADVLYNEGYFDAADEVAPVQIPEGLSPDNVPEGWEWRGPKDKGSAYNPKTGEYLRPDTAHGPYPDHYDYRDPSGQRYRVDPKTGRMKPR